MNKIEEVTKATAPAAEVIMPFEEKGEYYIEDLGKVKTRPAYAFLKRAMDIAVSLVGLLVLWFPMLIIAVIVAVAITKGGSKKK